MIRIKRINISNFGPIRTFDKEINNIEVFYGDNESGKTAIVDGIIRLLNLSTSSPFNREERRFNGYISMTLDINGRIIELSEEKKEKIYMKCFRY
jgi:predicted ATP-dependent endonuclease of OLD family